MKLHLPKMLLTAVLAACVMSSQAWADDETHWNITSSEYTTTATTISDGTTFYLGNGSSGEAGSGDANTKFESGKFTIENGGVLYLHGWTGSERTMNTDGKQQIASDIEIQGGGTLKLQDGSYYFSQNVNVTGTAENSSVIYSTYDKGFVFNDLTGAETAVLELQMGTWSPNTFTLQGTGAYAGSLKVGNRDGQTMYLAINSDQALASTASVHLMKSGSNLALNTASLTLSSISSNEGSIILAKNATHSIIGSATPVESAKVIISNDGNTTDAFTGSIGAGVTLELAAGSSQTFGQITNNGTIIVNENAKYNLLSAFEYDYCERTLKDTDGSTTSGNGFESYSVISLFKEGSTGSSNISTVYYEGTAYTVTDGKVTVEDTNYNIYYIGGTGSASTVDSAKITAAGNGTTLQTVVVEATGSLTGLDHSTGDLTVNGIISGDVNVTGGVLTVNSVNALSGDNVNITNGELKVSFSGYNNSAISHNTTVSVGAGGTLRLDGHDSIGWSANQAPKLITLAGKEEDGNLATMVINDANSTTTWCAPVEMNGYSKISGTKINLLEAPTLTVTKTNNVIDIGTIQLRSNMNVCVEENGALEITSLLERHDEAGSNDKLIKTGGGTLTLMHANATYENGTTIQAGTLIAGANSALGTGVVTIEENGTLQAASGVTFSNTIKGSGTYALGSTTTMNGTLDGSWTGTVSLSEATLTGTDLNTYGNANSTVELKSSTGSLAEGTINTNVKLTPGYDKPALKVLETNGKTVTFAGTVSGTGNFVVEAAAGANKGTDTYIFKGDVSGWNAKNVGFIAATDANVKFEGSATTINNGIYANSGTLNATIGGSSAVTVNGDITNKKWNTSSGTLNLKVENTAGVTFNNTVKVNTTTLAEGATATFNGTTDLGDLSLGAGLSSDTAAVTTSGELTIGTLTLDLSSYTTAGEYALVTTQGSGSINWDSTKLVIDNLSSGLLAEVSLVSSMAGTGEQSIVLTLSNDTIDVLVNGAEYANGTLTLNVVGTNGLEVVLDASGNYNIAGLVEGTTWDSIRQMLTEQGAESTVAITLAGDGDPVVGTGDTDGDSETPGTGNVSFYGKYYGEANVGASEEKGKYRTDYIPEPTTATLSLLALMGLAARRRRKA